jgi:hypothetical protein
MKTKLLLTLRASQITFCVVLFSTLDFQLSTFAQGTAFTYQGRLSDGGSPANGVYDFTFQAFDAPAAGSSIGGTVNVNGVGVSNGLFTALVDLGNAPFTGLARWLQIRVSINGAGSFTTLAPRQPLTPSPYAMYAHTAATVTNGAIASAQLAANAVAAANIQNSTITSDKIASGQVVKNLNGLTDSVSLTQGANVTINTVGNSLQISAPAGGLNLPFSGSASSTGSVFTLANSGTGPAGVFLGKLGVGNSNPQFPLDVAGPVRLTSVGNGAEVLNLNIERSWAFRQLGTGASTALELACLQINKDFVINTTGRVGLGTTTPTHTLHIASPAPTLALQDSDSVTEQVGYVSFRDSGNTERAWIGYGTAGSPHFSMVNARDLGDIVLTPGAGGHIFLSEEVKVGGPAPVGTSELFLVDNVGENWGTIFRVQGNNGGTRFRVDNDGSVLVSGNLSKGGGSFKIDHPLEPADKYLSHSFVESPDMMNIYNGNIVTDAKGNAAVTLPDWFGALNRDFRYQLTVIGQFAQAIISREISDNQFSIQTDKPNVKVSWQITGIRQDAYANAHRIPVEELKAENERGFYLHPDAFGQPEEKGVDRARRRDTSKEP